MQLSKPSKATNDRNP
jgi:hypothetical protein